MTLPLLLASLLPGLAASDTARVRDAHSGLAIHGTLTLTHADGQIRTVTAGPEPWPADVVAIAAPGYRTLTLSARPTVDPSHTILLTPLHTPPPTEVAPDRLRLTGHVIDADTATPVAGARIEWLGYTTHSAADGRYALDLPLPPSTTPHATAVLTVEHPEHPRWQQPRRLDAGVERRLPIALGVEPGPEHRWQAGSHAPEPLPEATGAAPNPATPPASIRVGFADAACSVPCCTGSCTHVCTMDFETYVRRGLDDEWIASWPAASLTAGAVAYRAYGAWRQANPIRPNFDICSNACCQVNDADTAASADAAVAATSGILLTRGGSRFAAEYSAENNSWDDPGDGLSCTNTDLSCGNGFAGSPATGWPCLADPVGSGWGCFGHGRGMSQWGTRGWALAGWRWPAIVDHYYNASGAGSGLRTARMSSPVSATAPQPTSATVSPGSLLTLSLPVTHHGGTALPRVLHQTLLRRDSTDWPDPERDRLHTLAAGSGLLPREHRVPAELAAGPITLLNRLWLDIDADGRVSSADLLLLERSDPGLLSIQPADRLHTSGFEAQP